MVNASVGYYYQNGDLGTADGSGVLGRLAYEMTSGVTAGVNISYDEAFDTRVSADIKVRFGGASSTVQRKAVQQLPVINALTSTPSNRDVRVHDCSGWNLTFFGELGELDRFCPNIEAVIGGDEPLPDPLGFGM